MSGFGGIGGVGGAGGGAAGLQQIIALRQQIIDRSSLLQDLRGAGAASGTAPAQDTTATPAGGFTGALKSALDTVNASQNRADAATDSYEKGETMDVAKVMLARQEAGVGFEATLQVRNRLLSAYQDIMRMGV
ncbi:flagellar hook-basal body complex protein FliE [Novosphingobium lentum]|uniref:flagellar hook-basal body complex protein FliE n=1 Tax=Novosphingobium lentum TaxID=145287 RepID=UPI00082B8096|nr:flagellar hook-basal body complex protein FliE [Novosphingobium lentum]